MSTLEEEKNQPSYQQVRLSTGNYNDLVISDAEGKEPYVFVSYKSQDYDQVFSIMAEMQKRYGLRVYYDKAFDSNNDYWVKQMLGNLSYPVCSVMLCFISQSYLSSYATLIELMHSQVGDDYGESIKVIPIFLEPLPMGNGGDFKSYDSQLALESSNTGLPSDGPERTVFNELFEKMVLRLEELQEGYDKNPQTLAGCLKQLKTLEKGAAPVIDTRFTYRLFKEVFNSLHCNQFHLHNYEINMEQFYQDFQGKILSAAGDFSPFGEIPEKKVETVEEVTEVAEEVEEVTEIAEPVEEVTEIVEEVEEVTEIVEEVEEVTEIVEEVEEVTEIAKPVEEVTEIVKEAEEVTEIEEEAEEVTETLEEEDDEDEFTRELDALVASMDESLKEEDFRESISDPDSERAKDGRERNAKPEAESEVIYQELESGEYTAEGGELLSVTTEKAYIILPKGITSVRAAVEKEEAVPSVKKATKKAWETAFSGLNNLRGVEVPATVKVLNKGAFQSCSGLKEVRLPEGLKDFPERLFKNCTSLEKVNIPRPVTCLDSESFCGCQSLKEVEIPEGVRSLYSGVFKDCSALERVTLPSTVRTVLSKVFSGCESLEEVILPDGLTSLSSDFFRNCKSLKEVILPEGLKKLSSDMFSNCESLEKVVIPSSVKGFEGLSILGIFHGCKSLKEVVIPEGVAKLPSGMFDGCTSLETVVIPSSVKKIGGKCFRNCKILKSATLPKKVDIKSDTFKGCSKKFLKDNEIEKRIRQTWLGI